MSTHKYKKPEASNIRGTCVCCLKYPQKATGSKNKHGEKTYRPLCSYCTKIAFEGLPSRLNFYGKGSYKKHKLDQCQSCGFVAVNRCQLDVDHIDGNHNNNDVSNLQTLCANCHRLKTWLNKDWLEKCPI